MRIRLDRSAAIVTGWRRAASGWRESRETMAKSKSTQSADEQAEAFARDAEAARFTGDFARAAALLGKAVRSRSRAVFYVQRGRIWHDAGQPKKAAADFAKAATLAPDDPHPRRGLARLLLEQGRV